MKHWMWILPLFLLIGGVVIWKRQSHDPVAEREAHVAKLIQSSPKTNDRMPASKQSTKPNDAVKPVSPGREWIGDTDEIIKNGKVKYSNKISKHWSAKLKKNLTRGMDEDISLEVKSERDLVVVKGHVATNVQQVVVIFTGSEKRNSYRALVDSQTGQILRTWDHTIHETFRRPASTKLTAFPLQSP